jgi:3-hydroxy-9,10-secoandrosta-1,3,5(10)-triene-9,17-dione monooxygenase reductase component
VTVSAAEFKTSLSRWLSGVSIVTTRSGERLAGLTVSAFTSASLDPPLVAVCIDRQANTLPVLLESGYFAINVLSHAQHDLSNRFASKKDEHRRFEGVALIELPGTRSPLIDGAVMHLDCQLQAKHDVGDHVLCIGAVLSTRNAEHEPLGFFRGRYHGVAPHGSTGSGGSGAGSK